MKKFKFVVARIANPRQLGVSENIDEIIWRVDGKVKEIVQSDPGGSKNTKFDYDAMGQRIAKHVYDSQSGMLEKSTYYTLDAQGNTLNTYEHVVDNTANTTAYQLAERQIYGSSRLGIFTEKVDRYTPVLPADNTTSYFAGKKHYELSNHLGNVLAVISDIKMPVDDDTDGTVDGYLAKLVNSTDYSPFGVQLDGRTFSSEEYRYGFQGQEQDDEVKGEGNSVNYAFRMHDPRVGRFFTVDPLTSNYPQWTPYQFSGNQLIHMVELEGLQPGSARNTGNARYIRPGGGTARVWVIGTRGVHNRRSGFKPSIGVVPNEREIDLRNNKLQRLGEGIDHVMNDMDPSTLNYKPNSPVPTLKGDVSILTIKYNNNATVGMNNSETLIFSNIEDKKAMEALEQDYTVQYNKRVNETLFKMGYGNQCVPCQDKKLDEAPADVRNKVNQAVKIVMGPSPMETLKSNIKEGGTYDSEAIKETRITNY